MLAPEWTGLHRDPGDPNGFRFEKQLDIGGSLVHLLLHIRSAPDTASTAMVVIARNHQHRGVDGAEQLQNLHHQGTIHGAAVE